ncbi:MAG: hypothetical protein JST89_07725 [Cyanobacteria bacterium SZAS-4]|nr:hypothetical protein [Cyanobacteria bacterium SZAS-4]
MKTQQEKPKVDNHFLIVAAEVDFVDRVYPTEKACFSEIWRRIRPNKRCQFCGSARLKLKFGNRIGNCGRCGKKFRLTAGTIFRKMRMARPYLVAIRLCERGIPCSARLLSRVCNIAYASALHIFNMIWGAVLKAMRNDGVLVSSFEFNAAICKRSLETPAQKHPVNEQEHAQEVNSESAVNLEEEFAARISVFKPELNLVTESIASADDAASTPVAPCPERQIYGLLSSEPRSIDDLVALSRLEAKVVIATVSILELTDLATLVSGNRVVLSADRLRAQQPQVDSQTQAHVGQFVWFIKKFFHGVSRRYIQIYLAAYWCFIDRIRWAKGAVFEQCCKTAGVDLKTFVSPLNLQFCFA